MLWQRQCLAQQHGDQQSNNIASCIMLLARTIRYQFGIDVIILSISNETFQIEELKRVSNG